MEKKGRRYRAAAPVDDQKIIKSPDSRVFFIPKRKVVLWSRFVSFEVHPSREPIGWAHPLRSPVVTLKTCVARAVSGLDDFKGCDVSLCEN